MASAIAASARIDPTVTLGPYVVVGDGVALGRGCRLEASCVVLGPSEIGTDNVIYPYAVLGASPQDRSYANEPTRLIVGTANVFREHVTVHRGTTKDRGETRIGDDNLFMAGCHVAHDCIVGDHGSFANGTLLAGHVVIGDYVVTGGRVAIAQGVRIGEGAFLAAGAMVERDIPPFVIAAGDRARVRAINHVGLERRGIAREHRDALTRAFRHLFASDQPLSVARKSINPALAADPFVARLLAFASRATPRDAAGAP